MGHSREKGPKLHVVFTKEEVLSHKLGAGKVAVVFDVLLATTTISALLHYGAKEIIPVMDGAQAQQVKVSLAESTVILTGESGGKTIDGFLDPLPTYLKNTVSGKSVVLSTTNGTVTILNASTAGTVYAASLLNGNAVATKIAKEHAYDDIIVLCAGSGGHFAMEDFYGAGYFISELIGRNTTLKLTDSAKAALFFYQGNEGKAEEVLKASKTGEMMVKAGLLDDVRFAANKGIAPVVPQFENGLMVVKGEIIYGK
ncbi:2-phosphosulfolactate phosphatase [Filibacter tadaridae]|uniref:Probable 2-phosphosulfolactate phosphatase n=1 Tax=Filibacter tadaridae TaxID=2483811 RepID=A0A3P5WYD7_9BACL|nr:2-phosphosulfolactate phosphatase [Filibacter tadaridae]VDC28232.1 putative 2-phosphosulfolactate phosphatase [Filibacter tadaridae]